MNDDTEASVVERLARVAQAPYPVTGSDPLLFLIPNGYGLHEHDPGEKAARPRQTVAGQTYVSSEEALVERCQTLAEFATVYVDATRREVVAILDDDEAPDRPGWRRRRIVLELTHTPEWQRWVRFSGQLMSQQAFAEHIEDCLSDIREPTAADMLEVAQSLEAHTDVAFRSGVRLANGQRHFTWVENTDARAGGGELEVPAEFELGLVPWIGRAQIPFRVMARLRYRVSPDGLQLGYKLVDVERILRTSFEDDIVGAIAEADGIQVVHGRP